MDFYKHIFLLLLRVGLIQLLGQLFNRCRYGNAIALPLYAHLTMKMNMAAFNDEKEMKGGADEQSH
jgi:hypothetical protein